MMNGNISDGCKVSESKKWFTASLKRKSKNNKNPSCAWTKEIISFEISPSYPNSSNKEMASL
jgi:hypothetical protein